MKSWISRLMVSLKATVFGHSDVIDLLETPYRDPARKALCMLLLGAIRDGDHRIRLEQRPHSVRVFRSSVRKETEEMPLNPVLGCSVIAAAMSFPHRSGPILAKPGTRHIQVLVGGHPVDLEFECLPGSHGEGVAIGISDRSVRGDETASENTGDAGEFSIVCISGDDQIPARQQTPGEWWMWYLDCLGGNIESAEYRHELEEWAKNVDSLSKSPGESVFER